MANYIQVRDALMGRDFQVARPNPVLDQSAWMQGSQEVDIKFRDTRQRIQLVLVDIVDEPEKGHVIVQSKDNPKISHRYTFQEFLDALQPEPQEEASS